MSEFDYLIERVAHADFETDPFLHLEIRNFFEEHHFLEIVGAPEIGLPPAHSDRELMDSLLSHNWEPTPFPGSTTSIRAYLDWRAGRAGYDNVETCEGFGVVFRLATPRTPLIQELDRFLRSDKFLRTLACRFGIEMSKVVSDIGIQKYLDGYEISPHPDIRSKALTFMVNVNPNPAADDLDHHTHYLRFKDQWRYVQEFWEHNPKFDRSWVPWDWCTTVKQQTGNNSAVFFSPSANTMHAVRARYDHLQGQRTQLYGNLWYGDDQKVVFERELPQIPWQGLTIDETRGSKMLRTTSGRSLIGKALGRIRNHG